MKRRDFLKAAAISTAALAADRAVSTGKAQELSDSNAAQLPRRPYGDTGIELSIISFGGIVVMNADAEHASQVVGEAVERGVNYFDVAPSYGNAEEKLGPALEPYRKDVFLACKTGQRTAEGAQTEFDRSLELLRTDHFDLYQLHGITSVEDDVDVAFADGGAMEVLLRAKAAGQVRHLGFSAHSEDAAVAAMERYDFDSVLFPVNFATWNKGNFGPRIMAKAQEIGAARLALKGLARQRWPENDPTREKFGKCWYQPLTDPRESDLGLRWTLSQPITAAVTPGEESLFRLAMDIAQRFTPVNESETTELIALADTLEPIFEV
ncbi:aldo/keto reductase [Candidatus Poribacteria bacterium]|jgi:aryl-alcohol dehydrogenase-like predicted oxidoreductase|nr:aldo/keto reductase [Candidatus Poribacteria bacterium]MBT5532631.1 aldo/keto reductase [Candidatus Poribacteria bacterium]MBT7096381.1 aldo/keto reductase [Candidatus Poribacteria bacterium]MBT7807478.1 aldo/keto reductase [Candidatus Poribacteria bacterium]